jgi:hypothetical protein
MSNLSSNRTTSGQAIAFAIPYLPAKTDVARSALHSCWQGERRAAYELSRQRLGITREAVWIQQTPDGGLGVAYLEAGGMTEAFAGITASDDPFDRWFRELVFDIHGLDLKAGFPPPEQILDYHG